MNTAQHPPIGLKQYYMSARGIVTAVAAVAFPLASKLVGTDTASYLFPPLGTMEGIARLGLVLLCLSTSIAVYFIAIARPPKSRSTVVWTAIAIAGASLITYLAAYQRFVRQVDVPAQDESIRVSVGYERTPFANSTFGPASDGEILRSRGINEEEIERLWTTKSIIVARITLYLSCVVTTCSFLFLFSFAIAYDLHTQT